MRIFIVLTNTIVENLSGFVVDGEYLSVYYLLSLSMTQDYSALKQMKQKSPFSFFILELYICAIVGLICLRLAELLTV